MQLEVGKILEGKVTGITKFGAFVELEPGTVGMVHISEVSNTYVNDIAEILKSGQMVKVKVLSVGDDKKISLSIKRALPQEPRPQAGNRRPPNGGDKRDGAPRQGGNNRPQQGRPAPQGARPQQSSSRPATQSNNRYAGPAQANVPKGPAAFEDMLSKFMTSSDEKISGLKKEHNVSRRAGSKRK